MLGASAVDPSSSWVSPSSAQSAVPQSPTVSHCSQPSTSYPHGSVTPNHTASEKSDICSIPSTSFATTPRQLSSASSEEHSDAQMTSSSVLPSRRVRLTFRLPAKSAHRLKRIANMQPQTLRRIGVSALRVGENEQVAISEPAPLPPPATRLDVPQREAPVDRMDARAVGPPPGANFQLHHTLPPDQTMPHQMQPRPPINNNNNNSPLLVNLLSSQQQAREGPQANGPPPPTPGAQRPFSPYQYPQQTPHPGNAPVDPQMAAMQQHQAMERQRMIMQQQQQQAMQQQQQQQQMVGNPAMGHPPTPGCVPQQGPPFFNANAVPPQQRAVANYPPGQAPPGHPQMPPGHQGPPQVQPMFPGQQQRMGVPQGYPGQVPQGVPQPLNHQAMNPQAMNPQAMNPQAMNPQAMNPQMQQPPFRPMAQEPPETSPPKKKRKPTKKQQKESEMAAAAAAQNAQQQQFMNEQRMMHPQHMGSPGMPMMGHNFPQANYPPQYGYPPGATPQQQQHLWQQHQMRQQMMQQQMMQQQQQQHQQQQQQQQQQAAAAAAQGGQWQRPVGYPPTTPLEGPGSVLPVSQRPSSEFGADGTSPMTPQSFPQQQQGMMNSQGPFMRNDSHGNLFNFSQPAPAAPAENPMDKLWSAPDDHLGDLGNLDDIDVQPMDLGAGNGAGLPADLLDEASSSSSTGEKQAPNTPNGDRIDSSIASVVEMVSKSNAQPTMTSISQAVPSTTGFGTNATNQTNQSVPSFGNPQPTFGANQQVPMQGAPVDQNARIGQQLKPVKVENGTTNGHREQLPNGAPRPPMSDDEPYRQFAKSLLVAEEQRKKAADASTKSKAPRKSRSKKAEVKEETAAGEEDFLRAPPMSMVHAAAHNFPQQLVRTQMLKQPGPVGRMGQAFSAGVQPKQ